MQVVLNKERPGSPVYLGYNGYSKIAIVAQIDQAPGLLLVQDPHLDELGTDFVFA